MHRKDMIPMRVRVAHVTAGLILAMAFSLLASVLVGMGG